MATVTALKTIYAGESDVITIPHTASDGTTAIPFADINDVRYIIKDSQGTTLLKFKENNPISWEAATRTANPGEFTIKILGSQTKTWQAGKVFLEWFINIDDTVLTAHGYSTMGQVYLYDVKASNYSEL
tara:strand:+ start:1150 stop:1536 length:387 start_codon:yes stop_codon:yes gene_type:complete